MPLWSNINCCGNSFPSYISFFASCSTDRSHSVTRLSSHATASTLSSELWNWRLEMGLLCYCSYATESDFYSFPSLTFSSSSTYTDPSSNPNAIREGVNRFHESTLTSTLDLLGNVLDNTALLALISNNLNDPSAEHVASILGLYGHQLMSSIDLVWQL